MKLITSDEMRRLDSQTIRDAGVPGAVLMERAGEGVADLILALAGRYDLADPEVHLFAGRGNNGGDAYVVARLLHEQDIVCALWMACSVGDVKGDARHHLDLMIDAGVPYQQLPDPDDWIEAIPEMAGADILVDGLLGIGLSQPPRGPVAAGIGAIRAVGEFAHVVAIDVPSGLNADTGEVPGAVVSAELTATMAFPKYGLVTPAGLEHCGNIEVVDIGIPDEFADPVPSSLEMITVDAVQNALPPRKRQSHKGTFGHALLVAGAEGYTGAPVLAARAALRSGAGLVTALVPEALMPAVAGGCPEAMIHGGETNATGSLAAKALEARSGWMTGLQACALGPGMTDSADTRALVQYALSHFKGTLVLDADALNSLEGDLETIAARKGPVVLTPHPGELARLLNTDVPGIQKNRIEAVTRCATESGAIVVLKGAGTLVADPDGHVCVNVTGNPGMACGGSGDVLTGLMTGMLAGSKDVFETCCAAVHLHGRAGDIAAASLTMAAMKAGDIIEYLPDAMREAGQR